MIIRIVAVPRIKKTSAGKVFAVETGKQIMAQNTDCKDLEEKYQNLEVEAAACKKKMRRFRFIAL